MDFLTEIKKLADGLLERKQKFELRDWLGGYQIRVKENDGTDWDVICCYGSYGYEEDFLEIMGEYVEVEDDTVEGHLTAEEILRRYDKKHGKNS